MWFAPNEEELFASKLPLPTANFRVSLREFAKTMGNFSFFAGFGGKSHRKSPQKSQFPLRETDSRPEGLQFVSRRGRI